MKIGYCRHCSSSELICANKDHDIRLCQHDPCDQKWVTEINECPKGGKKPVKIVCPECGSIQDAIEDHSLFVESKDTDRLQRPTPDSSRM